MKSAAQDAIAPPEETPWDNLPTMVEADLWIAGHDYALQQRIAGNAYPAGQGICFTLAAGGEIYLHTTGDGDILLDVTPDAGWAAPVITAATRVAAPVSQVWILPGDTLTQLILGLNSLIASSRIVLSHRFRMR
ncbi:MAG: hypothetical protein H7327_01875 [Herminiimonas sp.]|nr:hypothetical protein [Herminiimonas sp.]